MPICYIVWILHFLKYVCISAQMFIGHLYKLYFSFLFPDYPLSFTYFPSLLLGLLLIYSFPLYPLLASRIIFLMRKYDYTVTTQNTSVTSFTPTAYKIKSLCSLVWFKKSFVIWFPPCPKCSLIDTYYMQVTLWVLGTHRWTKQANISLLPLTF